ncbi:hypothetical protein NECAME_18045 [Necator americanus]|uniref:Uncharacterized protein n=1 Tax=Necator americanus TaxID=51031 RepID=W2TET2_NECAM|nr:hypothetical protein NECAME_18045 [Necator americanus]ETN80109.1 hypothetical protein NECAME_18045 [Necator americanus]
MKTVHKPCSSSAGVCNCGKGYELERITFESLTFPGGFLSSKTIERSSPFNHVSEQINPQ